MIAMKISDPEPADEIATMTIPVYKMLRCIFTTVRVIWLSGALLLRYHAHIAILFALLRAAKVETANQGPLIIIRVCFHRVAVSFSVVLVN